MCLHLKPIETANQLINNLSANFKFFQNLKQCESHKNFNICSKLLSILNHIFGYC